MHISLWAFLSALLLAFCLKDVMSMLNTRLLASLPQNIKISSLPIFRAPSLWSSLSPFALSHNPSHTSTSRPFSQSTSNMSPAAKLTGGAQPFLDTMVARRSIYSLNKDITIPPSRIEEIVRHCIMHVPSSFNSQSTRIVLLVNEEHDKFWEIVKDTIKAIVPADAWPASEKKLNGFKAGYGTILFYDDTDTVKSWQEKFAIYASKFPEWAQESTAMHQYAMWCALEAEGLGANLQHYNPIIDEKVSKTWNIPTVWKLRAEMVIGGRGGEAGKKTFAKVDGERFFVHGA